MHEIEILAVSLYKNTQAMDKSKRFQIYVALVVKEDKRFESSIILDKSFMQRKFADVIQSDASLEVTGDRANEYGYILVFLKKI